MDLHNIVTSFPLENNKETQILLVSECSHSYKNSLYHYQDNFLQAANKDDGRLPHEYIFVNVLHKKLENSWVRKRIGLSKV
jgi:hypothetical protein